jgi:hypothetical protein
MNYLHHLNNFTTVEEGIKNLKEAQSIRGQLGGTVYRGIIEDDIHEINQHIEELSRKEGYKTILNK